MRKGYYRVHRHHHPPVFGWLLMGLAVLFVLKALPFILPLLILFVVWQLVSHRACGRGFDYGWHDSTDEKRKRKNDDWDDWDDAPIIV